MTDAQILALLLLGLRVIATTLLIFVIVKQVIQIRTKKTQYPITRMIILILTSVLLLGQFIPITLDAVVAFFNSYPGRHRQPNLLSTSYALNNAIKDVVIGSLLVVLHYRLETPKRLK